MASEKRFHVPYGKGRLGFNVPPTVQAVTLGSKARRGLKNPPAAVARTLAAPLKTPALAKIAAGARTAAIVVSDITRPVPNRLILDKLLPLLLKAGVPRDAVTIIIGTGTHRPAPPAEIAAILGKTIAKRFRVENHDCKTGNTRVGAVHNPLTGEDIPVFLDRRYVEADLKIITGLVEPHIFCGYSGGRKALLPGIASLTSIRRWHGPELISHPKSAPGIITGNLAHALTLEASRLAPADFAVNVTLNRDREVTGVFAGNTESVFDAAVRRVESYVLTPPTTPAKVVVTSGAGWPLDGTFYQAIKGLVAVLPVLAQGGVVVLAARSNEGIGDEGFTRLVKCTRDVVAWSKRLGFRKRFAMGQWQLQRMAWVAERGRVFLVSDLPRKDAAATFTTPFGSLQEAVDQAVAETAAQKILVAPEGPYVITRQA